MRPAVVTAVLLLVSILDTVTAKPDYPNFCKRFLFPPCGEGGSRIAVDRCVTFMRTKKNFNDSQAHCLSLKSDLVSLHSDYEVNFMTCLTWYSANLSKKFWIGAKRSGGVFGFTDGSKFNYNAWQPGEPSNSGQDNCVESDSNGKEK
ncbi:hypothetical protein PFLUV_G00278270 [Perca fluviatilis]|uniref:C-type lectin domain-containing protein n=1 Tax=Perca fluviatilis TaxID=8168 RepID=A0A6A5DLW0_PERFL|nr:galactose-specific lectin nattectin-like [Perca fluviatilis]KAF1371447.1 hypothetical protein PFLUV_G00278270 [Perca fluviatilis]